MFKRIKGRRRQTVLMKYVILSDSDNIESFKIPRQLTKINGELGIPI